MNIGKEYWDLNILFIVSKWWKHSKNPNTITMTHSAKSLINSNI